MARSRSRTRRRSRRNPSRGALFVRANSRRRGKSRRSRRNRGGLSALVRRLRSNKRKGGARRSRRNGLALRTNSRRRKGRGRSRRNGLALRTNSHRRRGARRHGRRNGLALRTNAMRRKARQAKRLFYRSAEAGKYKKAGDFKGLRAYWKSYAASAKPGKRKARKAKANSRRNGRWMKRDRLGRFARRNGLALRTNRRRFSHGRGARRNTGASTMSFPGLSLVTGLVGKVPVVGKIVAPYLGPAVFGAAGLYASKFALKYAGRYLPAQAKPFGYTIAGLVLATAAAFLPVGGGMKKGLVAAAVIGGGAIDAFRFASGKSGDLGADDFGDLELGDGGAYELGGFGDPGFGAVHAQYADAEMADAVLCGPDLDGFEGEVALSGAMGWLGAFGRPASRAAGQRRQQSRHAGKPGHRWGWVIKLVGFENFQKIAAKDPSDRMKIIQALRKQAVESLPALMGASALIAAAPGMVGSDVETPLNLSGLGYGEQLGSSYGALVYAGRGY